MQDKLANRIEGWRLLTIKHHPSLDIEGHIQKVSKAVQTLYTQPVMYDTLEFVHTLLC